MIGRGKITLNKDFLEHQNKLIIKMFEKYRAPIIVNCNFAHVRPFNTFITGSDAKIEFLNNRYTISYENMTD